MNNLLFSILPSKKRFANVVRALIWLRNEIFLLSSIEKYRHKKTVETFLPLSNALSHQYIHRTHKKSSSLDELQYTSQWRPLGREKRHVQLYFSRTWRFFNYWDGILPTAI